MQTQRFFGFRKAYAVKRYSSKYVPQKQFVSRNSASYNILPDFSLVYFKDQNP